ncbi:MAG: hypothetical protein ACYCOO_09775 [Chitinophagaceae bacterium]
MTALKNSLFLIALVLGGCSSTYNTGQTPDNVYYSPANPAPSYTNSQQVANPDNQSIASNGNNGNYVTYDNGYGSGYQPTFSNASMFNPSFGFNSFYDPYNIYGLNDYGWNNFSPYGIYSPWGFNSGFSLGLSYGSLYSAFDPYYSPFYSYPMYSYGYLGNGYYGKPGYQDYGFYDYNSYNSRPANSWGPRRSVSSNANATYNARQGGYIYGGGSAPVRTFNAPGNISGSGSAPRIGNSPRRVFYSSPGEVPVNPNGQGFRPRNNFRTFTPQNNRVQYQAPSRSFRQDNYQAPQMQRSNFSNFNNSSGGNSPSYPTQSAPVRSFRSGGGL